MGTRRPSTLVIGGGIGGLSLAHELGRRGLPVTVLERAPKLVPLGAGIIMNPNAMRVLDGNGLAEGLRARGWPYLLRETCDARGRRLAVRDYRPLYAAGKLAVGTLVHRAHLHHTLCDTLPPATVRLGVRVTAMEVGGAGVRVHGEGGETFEADLLVGADGIRSQVREAVFAGAAPVYLGYRSHRMVVENADGVEHFTEFYGHGRRVGLVPISATELYVWTTFNAPPTLAAEAGARELAGQFREFTDPRVRGALGRVRSADDVVCTEVEEVHQPEWVRGRAVLLGDAAHALSPNMGQGAGMAMEDAAVLAEELAAVPAERASLETALGRYEARRWPRVETVTRLSREVGAEGQLTGRLGCWLRNRRLRRQSQDASRVQGALEQLLAYPT
jgi:2-heptyl-3-hydroxy-4(1H)-quinolone synthase